MKFFSLLTVSFLASIASANYRCKCTGTRNVDNISNNCCESRITLSDGTRVSGNVERGGITHALISNLALAAAIERDSRLTSTITKTIYQTEVRRLSTNYNGYFGKSESAISNRSGGPSVETVSKDSSVHSASSTSTTYDWLRDPGGKKPTISQLPVTGVPVTLDARHVDSASLNGAMKRDQTLESELETIKKRNANLYNLKAALAPEGYVSVYMSDSTASIFCDSETKQESGDAPKARELHLAVMNATKTVAIPIHGTVAATFCLEFKNAEIVNVPKSGKATASSTATIPSLTDKTTKVSTTEELAESTSSKAAASETDFDTLFSATKSRSSHTEETSDDSETSKAAKHVSPSTTSLDVDSINTASAIEVSSKAKTKSSASEAEENISATSESSPAPKNLKTAGADSSDPDTSISHSTKSKSRSSSAEEDDSDSSSTPKATPLALPSSTTATQDSSTDELFTVSSMNTWYPYISKYLETAEASTPTTDDTYISSITTTESVNGAQRLGRRGAPTGVAKRAAPYTKDSSMQYTSDYSWLATGSTAAASVASSNGVVGRPGPPSLMWRWWKPASTAVGLEARGKGRGSGDEAEQEKEAFFDIVVDGQGDEVGEVDEVGGEPTRVSVETKGVEEVVAATKLAVKQQDGDEDVDGVEEKDEDNEEEYEEQVDDKTVPDGESEPAEEATVDDNEEPTPIKKKPVQTKASTDDEWEAAPTTDASADVNEESTPTEQVPTDENGEAAPTSSSDTNTPPEDEEPRPDDKDEDPGNATTRPKPTTLSSPDKDSDPTPSSQPNQSKSKLKSTAQIPSLASDLSFISPSAAVPQATSPLPLPAPPAPTGSNPAPTAAIIWDAECAHLSTSIPTAQHGATSTLPPTMRLGCWRTLTLPTSSASTPLHATSAFNMLSDAQNRQLGLLCWAIIGLVGFCWL
ncbi:hypothetical protein G6011_06756 [Alternaria panax]|uniref:Uncharacterized protein n=1 Tax=Alternaria panax TaxID=48097 RepID=A0AAD4FJ34_9PLEO|nr:hypothetical protein G6011_06756 [Alternaria panax]